MIGKVFDHVTTTTMTSANMSDKRATIATTIMYGSRERLGHLLATHICQECQQGEHRYRSRVHVRETLRATDRTSECTAWHEHWEVYIEHDALSPQSVLVRVKTVTDDDEDLTENLRH